MAVTTMIGAKIHRREDPRLVSGEGRYIDDQSRPGTVYLSVVRSPHAHARIKSIDVTAALKAPGVVAIYTYKDFAKVIAGTMPAAPAFVAEKKQIPPRFPIAEKEVAYQGEPVAVVLTEAKYQGTDAANLIEVDYEVLPAVMDLEQALEANSPTAHSGAPDNLGWDLTYIPEDPNVMKEADVVVKQRILQQRLAPTPMETRGILAEYSKPDQTMTIWMSSQNPHFIRLFLAGALGIPETRMRVISPDVGGGFGSKISPYSEDYLVPAAAKLSGRPVKWIETRTESIQTTTHGRGQYFDVEAGAKKDGTLVALKVTQYLDMGAYVGTFGAFQAVACLLSTGAYNWKHVSARTVGILTNKVPTDPYRGAGRPEATHLCERMIDLLAGALKMDPAEIRRKEPLRPGLRLGRLREGDGHGHEDRRVREAPPRAGGRQEEGQVSRYRCLELDRDLRLRAERRHRPGHRRPCPGRERAGARLSDRIGHRLRGDAFARAGTRHDLPANRGRHPGGALRHDRAPARRHG